MIKPQLLRSLVRSANIPPVTLSSDDLRKLYEILNKKVAEACDIQINGLQRPEQMDDAQFENLKKNIRDKIVLTVMIQGKHGEQIVDTTAAPLAAENLPDEITTILFECSYLFRSLFNFDPRNRIDLTLNFHRQKIIDFSNPSGRPTTPVSFFNIYGDNDTWVNGVYESLQTFFKTKQLKRNFIHSNYCYDLLLWLFVLPIIFWALNRCTKYCELYNISLSGVLGVGIYIYLAGVMLLLFRFLFNYMRWLYPRTEHSDSRVKPTLLHRLVLFAIVTGIISTVILDFIKTVF